MPWRAWLAMAGAASLAPSAGMALADGNPEATAAIASLSVAAAEVDVGRSPATGLATFVSVRGEAGIPVAGRTPETRAAAFLKRYGEAFGLPRGAQGRSLGVARDALGMDHVRLQQFVRGVAVAGTEILVHLRGSAVVAANGAAAEPAAPVVLTPAVTAARAVEIVRERAVKDHGAAGITVGEPRLEILDPRLLGLARPGGLAWRVDVSARGGRESVWVSAANARMLLRGGELAGACDGVDADAVVAAGIGAEKAGLVQARALSYYRTSSATALDGARGLAQACADLAGAGEVTAADCSEVQNAVDAVGAAAAACAAVPPPAACAGGRAPLDIFSDDLEGLRSDNWRVSGAGRHWIGGSGRPPIFWPASGAPEPGSRAEGHGFWGHGERAAGSSAVEMARAVRLPAGARMRFEHSYGFEAAGGVFRDGAVVEYSTDGGATYADAGGLMSAGPYSGALAADGARDNPLAGRDAFVGVSRGAVSTELDLSSLAGEDVRIRFRVGTDAGGASYGWRIEAVRIYTCESGGTVQFDQPSYAAAQGATAAVVTVTRSGGSLGGVQVDYATADGTAVAGVDYSPVHGSFSFGEGDASKTLSVPLLAGAGGQRTFHVQLTGVSGPAAGLGAQHSAAVVVYAPGDPGALRFDKPVFKVSEAQATAVITVRRVGGGAAGVTVDYATSDGSAGAGRDYVAANGTVSFGSGEAIATFAVPIINDADEEDNETVVLTLSNPGGGATIARPDAVLGIQDNDKAGTVQFQLRAQTVSEGAGSASVVVTRTGGNSAVTVDYTTADGSAVAGADFTTTAGTLSFGPDAPSQTITVPILDDAIGEDKETLWVVLGNPGGGVKLGKPAKLALTIVENETIVQFGAPEYSVNEGTPFANVMVRRIGALNGAVSVNYATSDITATAGSDYRASSGTLSFRPGSAVASLSIPILNDATSEPAERLLIALSSPTAGAALGPQSTTLLTIADRDVTLFLPRTNINVRETVGDVLITVRRRGSMSGTVTVDYTTRNGTAVAPGDYTPTMGTLSFGPGIGVRTFRIPILDDAEGEGTETVNFDLLNPGGGAGLGTATGRINITDDDPLVSLAIANATLSESGGAAVVTVRRRGSLAGALTVDYTTGASGDTAIAGTDYTTTSGRLSFGDRVAAQSFTVPILNDTTAEPLESFTVTLSNASGGVRIGVASAKINIADEDPAVSFRALSFGVRERNPAALIGIRRIGPMDAPASVDFTTSDGTATAGSDYAARTVTVSFPPRVALRTVSIPVYSDVLDEPNETVNLSLGNPTGTAIGQGTATLTITDDDLAGTVGFAAAAFSGSEGRGEIVITVRRIKGLAGAATVNYATSSGAGDSAAAGSDYMTTSGVLTFEESQQYASFRVPIANDTEMEPNERFTVTLSSPGGGLRLGSPTTASVFINSDE